jgi:cyclic pyranopterin phosphate synthase
MRLDPMLPLAGGPAPAALGPPTYLRVVVTAACPMRCAYCHAEGDKPNGRPPLDAGTLSRLLEGAVRAGVRKIKFLGGEPLLRADLPEVVRRLRGLGAPLDLSVITSGAAPTARIHALFDAGLDRMNLSIHGWGAEAFARRSPVARHRALRDAALEALLAAGRPLKLNYVLSGPADEPDLGLLLDWAAGRPLVVNVLDELSGSLGPSGVVDAVLRLRGPASDAWVEPDPDSLDTVRLRWADGLVVEVKHEQLGARAPWRACLTCPLRAACKEGIHAVRLTHEGEIRPCMDRPDLGRPIRALADVSQAAVDEAWSRFLKEESR